MMLRPAIEQAISEKSSIKRKDWKPTESLLTDGVHLYYERKNQEYKIPVTLLVSDLIADDWELLKALPKKKGKPHDRMQMRWVPKKD